MNIRKLEALLNLTPSQVYTIYSGTVQEHRAAILAGDLDKADKIAKDLKVMRRILR